MKQGIVFVAATAAGLVLAAGGVAETTPYQEACSTFGGSYEERRTGCDPECVTTYICRFSDGTGRVCSEEGTCGPLGDGAAAATPGEFHASSASYAPSTDGASSYQDCLSEARDACQDECSGGSRREIVDCLRSCSEERCGSEMATETGDSATASSATSDSACTECMTACRDNCAGARRPREKQSCLSGCAAKCREVCQQ